MRLCLFRLRVSMALFSYDTHISPESTSFKNELSGFGASELSKRVFFSVDLCARARLRKYV